MQETAELLLTYKGLAVGIWFTAIFASERVWPAAPRERFETATRTGSTGWPRLGDPRRLGRNGGLWIPNVILGPLVVIPISIWAAGMNIDLKPSWWAGWQGLVLDLLLLDFWIYWWHRANHRIPLLWRFHEVHHLDRFLDASTAVRFHFGEVIISAIVRAAVIILFDISLTAVVVFEALVLMSAVFHHSNLRLGPRLESTLAKLIITPSIHWVHHHAAQSDTDSNYGTIFSFWDPAFRSRSPTRRRLDMEIGVERRAEEPLPGLFWRPFRRRPG